MGVEDIKTGASSLVGVNPCVEYASGTDLLSRDKLDRSFTGGHGSRDFGGGFGLEDTGDAGSWS